jgi:DNA-binding LytR/AlgR family response regulator
MVTRRNIAGTVLFTALFALAFINFYAPFGVNVWFHMTKMQLLFYSSLIILTGMLVIAISRILMFLYAKRSSITYYHYVVWVFAEMLSMAAFYAVYIKSQLQDEREFLEIYKVSVKNTALVLLLPYSVLWLYHSWRNTTQQLESLGHGNAHEKQRMVPFHDEKNTLRFSVLMDDLLYIQAMDNYVTIFYNSKNKLSKYVLRNSLKNLESQFSSGSIVRCHRSYLVNFEKVRVLRRDKDGLFIELDTEQDIFLPVSKTYVSTIVESFSAYTSD